MTEKVKKTYCIVEAALEVKFRKISFETKKYEGMASPRLELETFSVLD